MMRLKVILTGREDELLLPDAEMLRNRGLLVYTCHESAINEMIDEIDPDVVIINPEEPSLESTTVYHDLLDNIKYVRIPVIYTLSEDDVYLISRKRTAVKGKRNFISDNLVDGIKMALAGRTYKAPKENKGYDLSQILRENRA